MTPRPPTHREPTDEEMQCLPEGTLVCPLGNEWGPSDNIGESADWPKRQYSVPITEQDAPTLHEPITREALNKALRERDEARAEARESLRDKFAMAALNGLLASPRQDFTADEFASEPMKHWPDFAKGAYQLAGAMLKARKEAPHGI